MEVCYRREMNRNYLVMEQDAGSQPGYEARMLVSNHVEGLLTFRIKYMDERRYYYYDITSMQPLERLLEGRFIKREEIWSMMLQINRTLKHMEDYLLNADGLILDPEYIYVDPQEFKLGICLLPGEPGDFPQHMSRLLQYIMKKIDHRDRDSIVLAYGLYQESLKENYGMEDLMRLLHSEREREQKKERPAPTEAVDNPQALYPKELEEERSPLQPQGNPKDKKLLQGVYLLVLLFGILAASSIGIFFLRGTVFLLRMLPFLAAAFILGALLIAWKTAAVLLGPNGQETEADRPKPGEIQPEKQPWEIPQELAPPVKEYPVPEKPLTDQAEQETGRNPEICRLESLTTGYEDISISYVPFIIGKHAQMADYVLDHETVSRLHVRLDQEEGLVRVTDLNSTNGTRIDGRLMEANETCFIQPGQELDIADLRYIFRQI